jgi:hypothetical protein
VLSVRLTYRGPAALASALVTLLTGDGLVASWDPTQEHHTGAYAGDVVLEILVGSGPRSVIVERAVKTAVDRFSARFPGIDVTIEPAAQHTQQRPRL